MLGFLAMILFEMMLIHEMPESLEMVEEHSLNTNPFTCVLKTIPTNVTVPINFKCGLDGFLVPAV